MSESKIIKGDSITIIQFAPGITVSELVSKDTGATEISSSIATFDVGSGNTTHYHNAEESVIVAQGQGTVIINGQKHLVRKDDAVFITPGTHHKLINTGDGPFQVIYSYATVDVTRTLIEE